MPRTIFPSVQVKKNDLLPKQYPQYFSTIHKRLTHHFDNTEKIQFAAENKSLEYGVFMKKVNAVISSNLNNFDFSVDDLANAMALSRAQLFRKLKQLAQMSPSAYIRFTRLQEAKRLLQDKNEDVNVTEVSYSVGFSNVSHFTRSFKKQFGMNPSSLVAWVQPKFKNVQPMVKWCFLLLFNFEQVDNLTS